MPKLKKKAKKKKSKKHRHNGSGNFRPIIIVGVVAFVFIFAFVFRARLYVHSVNNDYLLDRPKRPNKLSNFRKSHGINVPTAKATIEESEEDDREDDRRALKREEALIQKHQKEPPKSSAQPVQSSNEDDYVTAAKEMQANLGKDEFIFVAYGNYAFVGLFNNWMCNTAFMNGVHARTLIIMTDDDGYKALVHNRFGIRVEKLILAKKFQQELKYNTYGYWKIVETRVYALGKILKGGVSMLLFEPDAIWVRNPLKDKTGLLSHGFDVVGFDDNAGGIGFGWLLFKTNKRTVALWKWIERLTSKEINKYRNVGMHKQLSLRGEQRWFNKLVKERHKWPKLKQLQIRVLSQQKYCSGQWYDGGRGGNGMATRQKVKKEGLPYVVQNNWIIGTGGKIKRAKRWGHWFLEADSKSCSNIRLLQKKIEAAVETFHTLKPSSPPSKSECPEC